MTIKRKKKIRTLKNWIFGSVLSIVLLQSVLMLSVIIITKTPENLEKSAVQGLSNQVKTRGKMLEESIANMSNISNMEWKVSNEVEHLAKANNQKVSEYVKDYENRRVILDETAFCAIDVIRKNKVTDCFIILETENEDLKDAIYLRDLNPEENPDGRRDILLKIGSSEVLSSEGIEYGSGWNEKLKIQEEYDFYNIPKEAGNDNNNLQSTDLGYFSKVMKLDEKDIPHICYSIPLLDENHNSYGVIGVGVTLDYLKTLMPSNEIVDNQKGTYCIGKVEDNKVNTIIIENTEFEAYSEIAEEIYLDVRNKDLSLYNLKTKEGGKWLACVYDFRLYNTLSPFSEEEWMLYAVADRNSVYRNAFKLYISIAVSVIVALIISVFGAYKVALKLNKPIETLIAGMDKMSAKDANLPQTGIWDFDNLAQAIVHKNKIIYESGSKMSDIIELSGLNLGVLEYSKASDKIFCTKKVFDIFRMIPYPANWKNNYISVTELEGIFEIIQKKLIPDETEADTYKYSVDGQNDIWVNIRRVGEKDEGICVFLDVTENMNEKEKIRRDRDYDVLTDLYNRRAFTRKVTQLLETNACSNGVLSMWDLDNLKYTNDTYGHDVGDKYICFLGQTLKRVTCGKSIAARFAGDEFALFVYDAPEDDIIKEIEYLHNDLIHKKMKTPDGNYIKVSASVGMARYSLDGSTYVELMKYADFAMYENKKKSKGNIKLFERDTFIKDYILVQGVGELGRILDEERVKYAFQPIVSLKEKKIYAYEALIRPVSDILNTPDSFLRIAESQSVLDKVEKITWFHAISEYVKLAGNDFKCKLFINSIPNQEISQKDYKKLEEDYSDILKNVVMELTESTKINEKIEETKRAFCKKMGIETALDDYGAGYNNSDILVSRKYDYMKLDRSLVREIHKSISMQTLVKGMIDYSHENGIKVIAEGIETTEELEVIMEMGADFGQGYFFAKPSFELIDEKKLPNF